MQLQIANIFTEDEFERGRKHLVEFEPIEYEKFRHGRVAEFNTVEELCNFLDEAHCIFSILSGDFELVTVEVLTTNWYDDDEAKLRIVIDTRPLY